MAHPLCRGASILLTITLLVVVWVLLRIPPWLQIVATGCIVALAHGDFFFLSWHRSKDPTGHIRLSVSNLEASTKFYEKFFAQIGATRVAEKGWATREGLGVWLIRAAHQTLRHVFEAPGLHHLCLKARSRKEVDELYAFLMSQEIIVTAAPRSYPQYTGPLLRRIFS